MSALLNEAIDAGITEWEFGSFLLHQENHDHYVLFDPENRDFQPLDFLAGFGIRADWSFDQETVGNVLVTHFRR